MRKLIKPLMVIALGAFAIVSCSKEPVAEADDSVQEQEKVQITLGASPAAKVKSALDDNFAFTWSRNDVLTLYSKSTGGSFENTYMYIVEPDGGKYTDSERFRGEITPWTGSKTFYGVYPWMTPGSSFNKDNLTYKFKLPEQTQEYNNDKNMLETSIGQYDYKYGIAKDVASANSNFSMSFKNVMSLVEFNITNETGESQYIQSIFLESDNKVFPLSSTVDFNTQVATPSTTELTNSIELGILYAPTVKNNATLKARLMMFPVKLTEEFHILVNLRGVGIYKITKYLGKSGYDFSAGKATKINIKLEKNVYPIGNGFYQAGVVLHTTPNIAWAPVNCGHHPIYYTYGLLYQWGRKYGQGYVHDNDGFRDYTVPTTLNKQVSFAEGNSEANKNNFYYGHDEWCTENITEWSHAKGNDPCPNGWRLPTADEIRAITLRYTEWGSYNGQDGRWIPLKSASAKIFLPFAGEHQGDINYFWRRGYMGCYWSSTKNDTDKQTARFLQFTSLTISIPSQKVSQKVSQGMSVRCVQDL